MHITENLSIYLWLFPQERFLEVGSKITNLLKDYDTYGQMLSRMLALIYILPTVALVLT